MANDNTGSDVILTSTQKALRINLNDKIYGTFSEIGAGQETVRYFFRVGGASKTIAKAMSAYDKTFSDAIYGREPNGRYVTEERVKKMLVHEWDLLIERLHSTEDRKKCFFTFANTVTTINYDKSIQGHGWLGIRFRLQPDGNYNEVLLHIKLKELDARQQQETIGEIGVNFVFAAYYYHNDIKKFIFSLYDNIDKAKFDIDVANFSGDDFAHVDNRLISLFLVKNKFTDAICFGPNKQNISAADLLYKKNVLILRGSFRPITKVNMDMALKAKELFANMNKADKTESVFLFEITLSSLLETAHVEEQDFLDRVDLINYLGENVIITAQHTFYDVLNVMQKFTNKKIILIIGIPYLISMFRLKYYKNLKGGILEAFGLLFMHRVYVFLYPMLDTATNEIVTSKNFSTYPRLMPIYNYLKTRIHDIEDYDKNVLHIFSREVITKIQADDTSWVDMVPEKISGLIKERKMFKE